ncbi:cytochrome P450 704C1-like [Primulina tabacum]|uniref:cytochrome P450 704C1-like n=1 Tax=Primulina tabacum TaxID=48773 RepID=UPI003F5A3948
MDSPTRVNMQSAFFNSRAEGCPGYFLPIRSPDSHASSRELFTRATSRSAPHSSVSVWATLCLIIITGTFYPGYLEKRTTFECISMGYLMLDNHYCQNYMSLVCQKSHQKQGMGSRLTILSRIKKWREQRKLYSPEFSTRVLRDFSIVIFRKNVIKLAKIVSDAANSNQEMDIQDLFMKSTLDSFSRVAFGVDVDSMCGSNEEGTKFSNAFDDASAMTICRCVDIMWKIKRILDICWEAKLKTSLKVIDECVHKLISSKIEQMSKSPDETYMQLKKEDILSRFLLLINTNPKCVRDIILNFIRSGKDTTATSLSWFIYMLCKHSHFNLTTF